ncbi:MAG: 4'-phosphopantetheinyl transferase family protein [Terriglobales bacterium]
MTVYWLEQAEADIPAENDWLSANETACLSRMRFAKRRADWRLGRWTAKHALSICLDVPAHPQVFRKIEIRAAPTGAPEVFFANRPAGVTISLSHREGIAACAVAMSNVELGCDLELVEPHSDAFVSDYFTIEEQALVARVSAADQAWLLALLWSGKESALKALHKGLRLDTRCVMVSPFAAACDLNGWSPLQVGYTGGQVFHGWWQRTDNILRTVVAAQPLDSPVPLRIPAHVFDCASRTA